MCDALLDLLLKHCEDLDARYSAGFPLKRVHIPEPTDEAGEPSAKNINHMSGETRCCTHAEVASSGNGAISLHTSWSWLYSEYEDGHFNP